MGEAPSVHRAPRRQLDVRDLRRQRRDRRSLGVFRPAELVELGVEQASPEWDPAKRAAIAQPSLFFPDKTQLRKVPYRFSYRYRCNEPRCATHTQSIIDWELGAAYWRWVRRYGPSEVTARVRRPWVADIFAPGRDTHLFVGNQQRFPGSFLVLGAYYPPRRPSPDVHNLDLGL